MTSPKLTVWYNTECPVCSAGIDWQRSRLVRAARTGAIEFRDINVGPDALAGFGAGVEDVRCRLHALMLGADSTWALTARSKFGFACRSTLGVDARWACRSSARSRASDTTGSPTCSMPGTAGRDIGDAETGDGARTRFAKTASIADFEIAPGRKFVLCRKWRRLGWQ